VSSKAKKVCVTTNWRSSVTAALGGERVEHMNEKKGEEGTLKHIIERVISISAQYVYR
jgi:hypothetical protein